MAEAAPIYIAEYDPEWPRLFEAEARRLRAALGEVALRVDHVGSTAVPGMAAKPVIDIQISVADIEDRDAFEAPLARLGYRHHPVPDEAVYPFFHLPEVWPHTHHLHVCQAGSSEERRHLAFRDLLRERPEVARDYERFKSELAARHSAADFETRGAYAEAKTAFIRPREQEALLRRYPGEG